MIEVEYLTDKQGIPKAVVIPIDLWHKLIGDTASEDELSESFENYCLNKAMDEAKNSPLMTKEEALAYLNR
jgi:hypothetical protein